MAQDDTFKCRSCGNEEKRLISEGTNVSDTPCPKCGGTMERKNY
jgi:predicted RNA-binding Zn-ribbon protein involved in translation (DUF1610 family)